MTRLLRFVAVAIAIAGAIDPAISISGAARATIAIVALPPEAQATRIVRDRVARELSSLYEVTSGLTSDAAAAVVIGERYPEQAFPDSLPVATVTMPPPVPTSARVVRIDAPREVPDATAIHLDVEMESSNAEGQTTEVTAVIAGLEVGRVSHRWAAGEKRWRAGIDAVPVGAPPYVIRVAGAADVVVDARRAPFRVEFYDPRPSWATTFIRRALESDARFQVSTLGFTARGVSAQTGDAVRPGDARLDAFDVVIVGGLDRLSAADARSLDRYMRERGGAVVVVPDQRIDAGPARDLVAGRAEAGREPGDFTERLLEQPAKLVVIAPAAPLQATELLIARALTPGAEVIARVPGPEQAPVTVSMPRGDGRLLFSGAMDAWRFRAADNGAFARFWQSAIAGLAMAVPRPIAIDVDPPLLMAGEQGTVIVRTRARDATPVSASMDRESIRLLPAAEAGVYRGTFVAKSAAGRSTVEVNAGGTTASRMVLVERDVRRVHPGAAPSLAILASSHRGIDVSPDRLSDLERFVRGAVTSPRATFVHHPMRSAWWILPFTVCLSAEWWLRRRRGLR